VKVLEEQIPYTMVGSHCRVRLRDLLAYRQQQDERIREAGLRSGTWCFLAFFRKPETVPLAP